MYSSGVALSCWFIISALLLLMLLLMLLLLLLPQLLLGNYYEKNYCFNLLEMSGNVLRRQRIIFFIVNEFVNSVSILEHPIFSLE